MVSESEDSINKIIIDICLICKGKYIVLQRGIMLAQQDTFCILNCLSNILYGYITLLKKCTFFLPSGVQIHKLFLESHWKRVSKGLDLYIFVDPEILPIEIHQTEVMVITLQDLAIKRVIAFLFVM